jgi:hypothetical protein
VIEAAVDHQAVHPGAESRIAAEFAIEEKSEEGIWAMSMAIAWFR